MSKILEFTPLSVATVEPAVEAYSELERVRDNLTIANQPEVPSFLQVFLRHLFTHRIWIIQTRQIDQHCTIGKNTKITINPDPTNQGPKLSVLMLLAADEVSTNFVSKCLWFKHDHEVQLYAFDILALDGDDLRPLPLSLRKTNLARLLARRPEGIFVVPFEQGEIGPDLFRAACNMGLEGLVSKRRDRPYRDGRSPHWVKVKNRSHPAMNRVMDALSRP
jgi:hypothetical protein